MKGFKTVEILTPFFDMPSNMKDLEAVYRTLAKSADQRLVRLEKLSQQEGYGHALQWSYRRAMHDIEQWSGEGATRFNKGLPKTAAQLRAKIADIKNFLLSETSTKKGITESINKRAETLNKNWGTDFSPEEIKRFFESELYKKGEQSYDSKTVLRAIARVKKDSAKIIKDLKEHKKVHLGTNQARDKSGRFLPGSRKLDTVQRKIVENFLNEYSQEVIDFFK